MVVRNTMQVYIRPNLTEQDAMRRIKGSLSKKTGRGKGCLVVAEAAIPSSGGQDRLKEARDKEKESQQLEVAKQKHSIQI